MSVSGSASLQDGCLPCTTSSFFLPSTVCRSAWRTRSFIGTSVSTCTCCRRCGRRYRRSRSHYCSAWSRSWSRGTTSCGRRESCRTGTSGCARKPVSSPLPPCKRSCGASAPSWSSIRISRAMASCSVTTKPPACVRVPRMSISSGSFPASTVCTFWPPSHSGSPSSLVSRCRVSAGTRGRGRPSRFEARCGPASRSWRCRSALRWA